MRIVFLALVVLVVLSGCGGGGGGSSVDKPALMMVGGEAVYQLSGSLSDGYTSYPVSGNAVYSLSSPGLPPVQGINPWEWVQQTNLLLGGTSFTPYSSKYFIAQNTSSREIVMLGFESSGAAYFFNNWVNDPVLVPATLKSGYTWSWSASISTGHTMTFHGTVSGPESVSTPIGVYSAYRIQMSLSSESIDANWQWWVSPDCAWPVRIQQQFESFTWQDGYLSGSAVYTINSQRSRK